jgi:hypothetical protein
MDSNDWTLTPTNNIEVWSPPESWTVRKPQQHFLESNIMDDTNNEKLYSGSKMVYIIPLSIYVGSFYLEELLSLIIE